MRTAGGERSYATACRDLLWFHLPACPPPRSASGCWPTNAGSRSWTSCSSRSVRRRNWHRSSACQQSRSAIRCKSFYEAASSPRAQRSSLILPMPSAATNSARASVSYSGHRRTSSLHMRLLCSGLGGWKWGGGRDAERFQEAGGRRNRVRQPSTFCADLDRRLATRQQLPRDRALALHASPATTSRMTADPMPDVRMPPELLHDPWWRPLLPGALRIRAVSGSLRGEQGAAKGFDEPASGSASDHCLAADRRS